MNGNRWLIHLEFGGLGSCFLLMMTEGFICITEAVTIPGLRCRARQENIQADRFPYTHVYIAGMALWLATFW